MTAVNCPMCALRFATKNERDWHLCNEHEHLHVHPPTNRPVEWPHHAAPSRVDKPRRQGEAEGMQDETSGD
jgi:hypothetical protein